MEIVNDVSEQSHFHSEQTCHVRMEMRKLDRVVGSAPHQIIAANRDCLRQDTISKGVSHGVIAWDVAGIFVVSDWVPQRDHCLSTDWLCSQLFDSVITLVDMRVIHFSFSYNPLRPFPHTQSIGPV